MVESAVQDGELIPIAGRRLGRYELVSRLARGGMAEVWLARQIGELGFSRVVALKMIRPEHASDASFRNMFLDEARLAARLHHANAVEVLDLGETEQVLYLAMAYVEGESLHGLLGRLRDRSGAGARLPVAVSVRIVSDVCAGLHAAHELLDDDGRPLDLVHRDVSPHNVLVGLDGIARVTDFGIAKALGRLTEETETGHVKGKLAYLSPEQARRMPSDRRADIFAAGIILWELLTGRRLFKGEDVPDTLLNVSTKKIESPRALADVPVEIAEATMRALEREPSARYQTASEMADALEAAARAAGQLSTAKTVSEIVGDLVLDDVERRRAGVRASTAPPSGGTPSHRPSLPSVSGERAVARTADHAEVTVREGRRSDATSTRTSSVVPAKEVSTPARRVPFAWIGVGAAVAAGITWIATARERGTTEVDPDAGAPPQPAAAVLSTAATTPIVPSSSAGLADALTTAPATSASQASPRKPPSMATGATATAKRSAEPPPAPSARPKYDNPYGQ
jgi:serine/threonine protein kinase